MSNGLIDYDKSNIDAKQYIYYPIVEPFEAPTVLENEEKKSLSLLTNSDHFDKVSQYSSTFYEKITRNVSEIWLFSEIMVLLRYRSDTNSIQGPLADYLNNNKELKILYNTPTITNIFNYSIISKEEEGCCCCNDNNNYSDSNRLSIKQFIKYYTAYSSYQFDNKRSNIWAPFDKISSLKSNLAKFDNKDIITKNIEDEKISNTMTQEQIESSSSSSSEQSSLIPCNYCNYKGKSETEVLVHSVNVHPRLSARPDPNLLKLIQNENEKKKEEI